MSGVGSGASWRLPNRFLDAIEVGRGGTCTIVRAYDQELGRPVAVKILNRTLAAEETLKRLQREGQWLAELTHPNIVAFLGMGEFEDQNYLVLEYVEGGDLISFCTRHGFGPGRASLFAPICDALQWAHDHRVVHRDLKPQNILMTADGTPKIADFGLARQDAEPVLTEPGAMLGTMAYLAPEQIMTSSVGPAADLYALGVCLFEAVTGSLPFPSPDALEVLRGHLKEPPPRPTSLRGDLPPLLEDLILVLLEKAPERRPPSAGQVGDLLRKIGSGGPPVAAPPVSARPIPATGARAPLPVQAPAPPPRVAPPAPPSSEEEDHTLIPTAAAAKAPPPPGCGGLRVVAGLPELEGKTFEIGPAGATLGRSVRSDIVLPEAGVSRLHARIECREGRPWVVHCSGTNATFVNGTLVGEAHPLRDGDRIGLADQVVLLYTDPA